MDSYGKSPKLVAVRMMHMVVFRLRNVSVLRFKSQEPCNTRLRTCHWSQVVPTTRSLPSYSTVKLQRHSGKRDVSPSSGVRNWRDYFQSVPKFFYANSQNVSSPSRARSRCLSSRVARVKRHRKLLKNVHMYLFRRLSSSNSRQSEFIVQSNSRQWLSGEKVRARPCIARIVT